MTADPHKRNLIAISSAIAIFYLGEGDIQSVSTLFGAIKLKNPQVLLVGVWLMLAYSLWQYWLRSKSHKDDYSNSWTAAIRTDPKFHVIAKERLSAEPKRFEEDLVTLLVERNQNTGNHGVTVAGSILRRKFLLMDPSGNNSLLNQKPWSIALDVLAIKYMFKALFSQTHFSDYILPYLFAAIAIVVAITKSLA